MIHVTDHGILQVKNPIIIHGIDCGIIHIFFRGIIHEKNVRF